MHFDIATKPRATRASQRTYKARTPPNTAAAPVRTQVIQPRLAPPTAELLLPLPLNGVGAGDDPEPEEVPEEEDDPAKLGLDVGELVTPNGVVLLVEPGAMVLRVSCKIIAPQRQSTRDVPRWRGGSSGGGGRGQGGRRRRSNSKVSRLTEDLIDITA